MRKGVDVLPTRSVGPWRTSSSISNNFPIQFLAAVDAVQVAEILQAEQGDYPVSCRHQAVNPIRGLRQNIDVDSERGPLARVRGHLKRIVQMRSRKVLADFTVPGEQRRRESC